MSDTFQELADIPKVRLPAARMLTTSPYKSAYHCSTFADSLVSRTLSAMACNSSIAAPSVSLLRPPPYPTYNIQLQLDSPLDIFWIDGLTTSAADKREFLKISQAVGVGFVIMGAIGYFVKLIHIPVNNVLVG
ncbi:hypothetical protein DPV78_008072 [Talaromyces pinophilus]|nr:hypothetical protein DPV78_008072 [Talaromyces pinophilus]